jgi:carbon-monoxide dehydrogenase small subunit
MYRDVCLTVNGKPYRVRVKPSVTLLELLREHLHLTGTKEACGMGECGACTVILNGRPVNACLVLAVEAEGCEVTTIEGLASDGRLHPIQKAFVRNGAIQCGFCTPGMVMMAKALLDANPTPTREEVKRALMGNICRCTGYVKIIEAVLDAARESGGEFSDNGPEFRR